MSPSEAKSSILPSVDEPLPMRTLFSEVSTEKATESEEPPIAKSSDVEVR